MKPNFEYPAGEPVIRITYILDALRAQVWEAMTKPEHIARWWGPRRYKTVVDALDLRVGGTWCFRNESADGQSHRFSGEYLAIEAPERIVQTFGYLDFTPSTETMTLTETDGQTELSVVSRFASLADRDQVRATGMQEGATETYERLAELSKTLEPLTRPSGLQSFCQISAVS
jgi:uncharacterized protein YndB with AHSA1/START domain